MAGSFFAQGGRAAHVVSALPEGECLAQGGVSPQLGAYSVAALQFHSYLLYFFAKLRHAGAAWLSAFGGPVEVITIEGGHPITGEVTVEGAKNSALKLMAATILAPGVSTLTNVPNIADVHVMGKVLKELGAKIDVLDEHTLAIAHKSADSHSVRYSEFEYLLARNL